MKYGWRSGNTTYFEDRRFEGTVIFDGRIKPHFVKVEITLPIFLILAYAHRCLVNVALLSTVPIPRARALKFRILGAT